MTDHTDEPKQKRMKEEDLSKEQEDWSDEERKRFLDCEKYFPEKLLAASIALDTEREQKDTFQMTNSGHPGSTSDKTERKILGQLQQQPEHNRKQPGSKETPGQQIIGVERTASRGLNLPRGNNSGGPDNPVPENSSTRRNRGIKLLYHSSKCLERDPNNEECTAPYCLATKKFITRILKCSCEEGKCLEKHCSFTKKLINHWKEDCRSPGCKRCLPVRDDKENRQPDATPAGQVSSTSYYNKIVNSNSINQNQQKKRTINRF